MTIGVRSFGLSLAVMAVIPAVAGFLSFGASPFVDPRLPLAVVLVALGLPSLRGVDAGWLLSRYSIIPVYMALAYLLVYASSGLLAGLGPTPYSFTPTGILYNSAASMALLLGEEVVRASVVWRLRDRPVAAITVSSLIVAAATSLTPSRVEMLGRPGWESDIISWVVSVMSVNVAAGMALYSFGLTGAIAFRAPVEIAPLVSPVLPALDPGSAPIAYGLALAAAGYVYLRRVEGDKGSSGDYKTVLAAAAVVAFMWVASGVFGFLAVVVLSDSMAPEILRGDIVVVERVEFDDVGVGDIVMYVGPQGPVVHRVVEVGDGFLVTKGDYNRDVDPYRVTPDMLVGEVVLVIPEAGNLTIWLRSLFSEALSALAELPP